MSLDSTHSNPQKLIISSETRARDVTFALGGIDYVGEDQIVKDAIGILSAQITLDGKSSTQHTVSLFKSALKTVQQLESQQGAKALLIIGEGAIGESALPETADTSFKISNMQKLSRAAKKTLAKIQNFVTTLSNFQLPSIKLPTINIPSNIRSLFTSEGKAAEKTSEALSPPPKLSFHATSNNNFNPVFSQIDNLMGEMTLSKNERLILGGFLKDNENPTPVIQEFLSRVKEVRESQINSLKEGKGALSVDDPKLLKLIILNRELESIIAVLYHDCDKNIISQDGLILTNLFGTLTERGAPRNNQVITDLLYPDCVLYDKSGELQVYLTTLSRTCANYKKAEENIGMTKGFIPRNTSNLLERRAWEGVETQDDIFREGFCKVSFLTTTGHRADAGAQFDLKPLGDLSRDQVKVVFDLTTELLISGEYDTIIKKHQNKLGMTEYQLITLKTIVTKFFRNMEDALTLSLISIGSENEFVTTSDAP